MPHRALSARPARPLAARWAQLVVGFAGWGLAAALMIRAELGVGPWDAFHVGVHLLTGIGIGTASIVTGAAILLLSLPFGVRPGLGTLANMVGIGLFMNAFLPLIPAARGWPVGVAYFAAGLVLAGWFTGVYVAADLGSGPRDGLVLRLAQRTGRSVRLVRAAIELSVLGAGWAMGGPLGVGTLLFAAGIGPSMQWGLARWGVLPAAPDAGAPRVTRRAA